MSWAARRRVVILLIVGAFVIAFLATVSIAALYETPSCADGMQNQGEDGIDCGGACAYLCTAQVLPPAVLFTKALGAGGGRTDVIASVENKNVAAAAKDVPYRITLFGTGQSLIQEVTGTLDLPPGAVTPVYVPGIASGKQVVVRAFLSIAEGAPRWFALPSGVRAVPFVSNIRQSGALAAPRIDAALTNPTSVPFSNVRTIILVHDKDGDVMAASQTVILSIPAQGQATATFTWNRAFPDAPVAIEVVPIVPLSGP